MALEIDPHNPKQVWQGEAKISKAMHDPQNLTQALEATLWRDVSQSHEEAVGAEPTPPPQRLRGTGTKLCERKPADRDLFHASGEALRALP